METENGTKSAPGREATITIKEDAAGDLEATLRIEPPPEDGEVCPVSWAGAFLMQALEAEARKPPASEVPKILPASRGLFSPNGSPKRQS